MIRRLHRRCSPLLRFLALSLLLLAVLANPVFAAVGDLHESSHGSAGHTPPADAHDHDDNAGTQEEGVDLLHALMHAAHCCGHLTAILSTPFFTPVPSFCDAVPDIAFAAPPSAPRTDPFRPPIAI